MSLKLKNWHFKNSHDSKWIPVVDPERTSTEIFVDLIENDIIPDPFYNQNEKQVQWVGETSWDYKSTFKMNESDLSKQTIMKFNGLDTFASVQLNGTEIFQNDNMFELKEIDITKFIKPDNELIIIFQSALLKAREISKNEYGGYIPKGFNGEGNRAYIRKAQYHYGWDWGPLLMSCGPYRDIELIIVEDVHLKDTYIYPKSFGKDFSNVILNLELQSSNSADVIVEIISPSNEQLFDDKISLKKGFNKFDKFQVDSPELWYPNNYGTQPLYSIKIKSLKGETLVEKRFGIRKIELDQTPLETEPGKTFHFKVNDVPIYVSGVNWIPGHSFQTKLTNDDYHSLLKSTKSANFNMVRIWGGGVYEQDCFYEICDQLGLLIWHDFMFACGQYPGDSKFISLVSKEVESQLVRLRNHCSIILWCGNNEDYQVAEQLNLKQNFDPNLNETTFPAQILYEQILPKLVTKHTYDQVVYHPGSPFGGADTTDMTVGDLHQWNVWHGTQEPYQDWDKLQGRFVSEFGMLAFANIKTLSKYITDKTELYPQSETVCFHNKASGSERRVGLYISENFKFPKDGSSLSQWCYLTQLMQSDCLVYAIRYWKRDWLKERLQSGYIVWQINDCWPVNSWAIIDFDKVPKLAYYSIKRENSLISAGCKRLKFDSKGINPWTEDLNDDTHQYAEVVYGVDLWCSNLTLADLKSYKLKATVMEVNNGEIIDNHEFELDAAGNQSTPINNKIRFKSKTALVHLQISDSNGSIIYRMVDWPQPLKFLKFAIDPKLTLEIFNGGLIVEAGAPVKGLELYSPTAKKFNFLDNCIDLVPGVKVTVEVEGLVEGDAISYRYYDMA